MNIELMTSNLLFLKYAKNRKVYNPDLKLTDLMLDGYIPQGYRGDETPDYQRENPRFGIPDVKLVLSMERKPAEEGGLEITMEEPEQILEE